MGRRIWIISKGTEITQAIRDEAAANNCPEIACEIPPVLGDIVFAAALPLVYEEPDQPLLQPPISSHIAILDSIDAAKARPARIKRVWEGNDYYYDCLVTETVKDQYISGDIIIGDYLLVHFDDIGEQIVTAKIFKSW